MKNIRGEISMGQSMDPHRRINDKTEKPMSHRNFREQQQKLFVAVGYHTHPE